MTDLIKGEDVHLRAIDQRIGMDTAIRAREPKP